MKKINVLIVLAFILAGAACADAQLRYGLRLGGEISAADLSRAGDAGMKNGGGFTGGIMFEYQMPRCGFAADVALLYTRYNQRLESDGKLLSAGRDFIEIPLHLKYKFWLPALSNTVGPMVYTGPDVMFRCGGKNREGYELKRVIPGWDVGVGIDVANFLQLSGGYRFGLGNAAKHMPDEISEGKLRADGWHIDFNILFDF